MVAPPATKILGVPAQAVALDAVTTGIELTITATVLLLEQPIEVPVIV